MDPFPLTYQVQMIFNFRSRCQIGSGILHEKKRPPAKGAASLTLSRRLLFNSSLRQSMLASVRCRRRCMVAAAVIVRRGIEARLVARQAGEAHQVLELQDVAIGLGDLEVGAEL